MTLEIFLAVAIFILLVLVSIEDALTGFLLLLMLIPLQHKEFFSLVYWDVLPIRIAFIGLILTTGYRSYLWFRRNKNTKVIYDFLKDPILIFLFLLYLVRLISLFFADNLFAGAKLLVFYTVIVYFYILIKHLYLKHGQKFIDRSILVYLVTGIVTGIIALVQFFSFKLYDIKFGAIWEIPGHNPRIGSTFWDVNHYGAFIASIIPFSLLYVVLKPKSKKALWVLSTLFLGLVLYLTQSRSAWLGVAVSVSFLVVALFLKGLKSYAKYLVILGVTVSVVFVIYAQISKGGVVNYYKQFMHTRLDSFDTHFILLRGAFESYSNNPFLGGGYGNFNESFRKTSYADEYFFRERYLVDKRVPSHSIWGEVISETGFLGLSLYVLIFFTILSLLFRGFLKSSTQGSLTSIAAFTSILTLLISGIFYTYNLEFYWFIVFLGAMVAYEYNKDLNINKYFDWLFNLKHLPLIFLSIYSFLLIFWDISKNKLIDWDEAIYAEVSKNIIKTGDYITLHWDLGSNWFEKPPLYFWISSTFMRVFGVSEFSARLPSAIAAFLSVIVVYFFAKYLFKSRLVGFLAGLMLTTTAHIWYYGRLGMLDVTVGFFILVSLFFAYKFLDTYKYRFALYAGLFTGFAIMTKAIVGLLPIGIIFIYLVYLLISNQISLKKVLLGSLYFTVSLLAVALPWHLVAYFEHGQRFIDVYINEHILGRGFTDAQGKTRPFFWYIDVLRVSMRGWFLILIPSFIYAVFKSFKKDNKFVYLLIYSLVTFLFFSISTSKLIWYLIPIYPPLVIINAAFLLFVLKKSYALLSDKDLGYFSPYVSYKNLVGGFSILFTLGLFIYILDVYPKVFYPDFNKDRVAVIEAYNEKYVDSPSSVNTLYYLRMDSPVVKFYVKGPAVSSDIAPFTNAVEDAGFSESLAYISRQGEVDYFVNLYGNDRVVPSYNAGAYSLMYVRSLEEFYSLKVQEISSEILQKSLSCDLLTQRSECVKDINNLQDQLFEYQQILHDNLPDKHLEPVKIYYK